MANNRIKVAGYAKKVVYDGGIEYRNFSDSLVGNQFTSDGGTTLFTAANFNITTNLDPKDSKIFNTNSFGEFVSLDDLRLTQEEVLTILENNTKVILKFDKSELTNYAYFGSLREFVRVSLESIIMNWPAALYVSPINEFNPFLNGATFENYIIDDLNGTSFFSINSSRFVNKYNINYTQSGEVLNSFSDSNELRNMSVNYGSYNISTSLGDFPILGFTGTTDVNNNTYFHVSGNPFISSATTINYHIKPNNIKIESFFNGLSVFEGNLLNRFSIPIYSSNYKYDVETEQGNVISSEMTITWPTSDGYNIDFDSEQYINFVSDLLTIADNNDITKTNLMTRFLVSESITDFDTVDQKMGNTLRIYGREFDEVKKYIDGLAYANTVTYDGVNNSPNIIIKNLAKVMGWDLISSISEIDLINNYLNTDSSTFDGHSRGLTPAEAEVELWRRIILNTPWLWKSKGTRKAVEFLFKFIGSPDGLVNFNEFIYVADKSLNMDLFNEILIANSGTTGIDGLNIDSLGFPKILPDTPDMYFQKGGLWYRETGGPNSNIDILTGNNPHIGPYDAGQEYINQFSCLIPNFEPVILVEETILTGTTNLFTNYDEGEFDGIFENDVVLVVNTDIDFESILINQVSDCVNNLQIVPDFSGCSATTEWVINATFNDNEIYTTTFGTNVTIQNGSMVSGETLHSQYIEQLLAISAELSEFVPLQIISGSTSLTFLQDLDACDDKSYYNGKNLTIELCLNTNYQCAGGDCQSSSLIVSEIDSETNQVYFSNVLENIVPSTACCTNLGYDFSAVSGGYYCYEKPLALTNNANIYVYFNVSSILLEEARAAVTSLTEWFNSLTEIYPSYVGNLYFIPTNEDRWLRNTTNPWSGDISQNINSGGWNSIAQLPPTGGTDSEVVIINFTSSAEPNYHANTLAQGFGGVVQPSSNFRDDYESFINVYPNYNFFRCLLYPIIENTTGKGGSFILHSLASIEGKIIPINKLPMTNVDVSLLTTENPYINAEYTSGTMTPLSNFGFEGKYNKQAPALSVFNSQTFVDDLNDFISS